MTKIPLTARRIIRYGLPALALTLGGVGVYQKACQPSPARSASLSHTSNHLKSTSFDSASAALAHLLKTHDPQIVAVGEFHNEFSADFVSTAEHFAKSFIPILAANGYQDIIHEFIPNDPLVYAELDHFNTTGNISAGQTPFLSKLRNSFDGRGAMSLLEQSKTMGITLHGCNIPLAQEKAMTAAAVSTTFDGSVRIDLSRMSSREQVINTIALRQARSLLRQGKRIVLYTGLGHNDTVPTRTSFGAELDESHAYLEIDLIPGDIFQLYPGGFPERSQFFHLVPRQGALLIQRGEKSFTILLPFSS